MSTLTKAAVLFTATILTVLFITCAVAARPAEKVSNAPLSSQTKKQVYYILKEYKGKIAVFSSDDEIPIHQIDVLVDSLPERDQEKLKKGIKTSNPEEALLMAEDYE